MEKANNTQNEQIVKGYVRNRKPKKVEKPVRRGDKAFAIGTLVYFLLLMAKYRPVLFAALVLSVAAGLAYKYYDDHRIIIYDDIAGGTPPVLKAKQQRRDKSDFFTIVEDGVERIYYKRQLVKQRKAKLGEAL